MPLSLAIALVVLAALAGACAVYALLALARLRLALRSVPTLRAGLDAPAPEGGWPSVLVVTPAHNERAVIGELCASLRAQDYPNLRVVLALDRCTDGTAEAARTAIGGDARFGIVEIDACPEEWAGKCHAAHRGVTRAPAGGSASDLLLFADADTIFGPSCVRAAVGLMAARDVQLLSLLSTLTHRNWHERVAQPAASLELMRHFPIDRINRDEHGRSFANGQFMLFRREAYEAIGGHEAVRRELLEDLAFARLMRDAKRRVGVFLADGLFHCRMYPTFGAFRRGWKRIYIESAQRKPGRLRRWAAQLVVTGALLPLAALAAMVCGLVTLRRADPLPVVTLALGALGLGLWLLAVGLVHRVQRAPAWTTLVHPVGAVVMASVLLEGAADLERGRGVQWAGRTYARPVR